MRSIIFNKAGKIALTRYVNGTLTYTPANMSVRNGTVASIQSAVSYNTTTLPDGNSDWPAGEYDIGADGRITVNFSSYQPEILAFLLGTTVTEIANMDMFSVDEEQTVPSVSPYTVQLRHIPNANMVPILTDDTASPFVKVASAPASGQFSVSGDIVTLNSADAGKNVFSTYIWGAASGKEFGLPKLVSRPALQCIVSGEATSEDESEIFDANIIVDRCKAVGDINPPEASREPKGWSVTLKVLKPRGQNKAVDYKLAQRAV